ncbi:MAG: YMGG-like glycine zipper-containing protein [Pseudomonadota bacterium]
MRPSLATVILLSALAISAAAQADDPDPVAVDANSAAAPSGADVYVYPSKGQSDSQRDRDRYECHNWAAKQTGFDPSAARLAPHQQVRVVEMPPDHTGAVNGAMTGAVLGAVVSRPYDAARGAVVGAVAGAVLGSVADSARAREVAGNPRPNAADQVEQARIEKQAYDYRRAISACLEGRGYTVK